MKPEPESLNIPLSTSSFSWRSQRFFILASALLSLYVIWPVSLPLAVCALLVGTPLFWLIFGSNIFHRLTSGLPHVIRFIIVLFAVLAFAKLLVVIVNWFAVVLGSYGIA
jgi:hypothetical protein